MSDYTKWRDMNLSELLRSFAEDHHIDFDYYCAQKYKEVRTE